MKTISIVSITFLLAGAYLPVGLFLRGFFVATGLFILLVGMTHAPLTRVCKHVYAPLDELK